MTHTVFWFIGTIGLISLTVLFMVQGEFWSMLATFAIFGMWTALMFLHEE